MHPGSSHSGDQFRSFQSAGARAEAGPQFNSLTMDDKVRTGRCT